jgi:aspartokinase
MTQPLSRVLKFGGSTIGDPRRLREAARMVRSVAPTVRAVVASAPKGLTDILLGLAGPFTERSSSEAIRAVGQGDLAGAALLAAALRSEGLNPRLLLPDSAEWPIVTSEGGWEAPIDLALCQEKVRGLRSGAEPPLYVLPGYVALPASGGGWSALGRGGSDVSAIVLGRCLGADEVVLIKDVPGVLSGDPARVPEATVVAELTVHEMACLAEGGARVVAAQALQYVGPQQTVRVVALGADLHKAEGTRIVAPASHSEREVHAPVRARRAVELAEQSGWGAVVALSQPPPMAGSGSHRDGSTSSPEPRESSPLTLVVPPEDLDRVVDHLQRSGDFRAMAVRSPSAPLLGSPGSGLGIARRPA